MTKNLQIKFDVSDGIPGGEMFVRDCMDGIKAMQSHLTSLDVPELRDSVTVSMLSDIDKLDEAYAKAAGHRISDTQERWKAVSGSAAGGQIFLNQAAGHFDDTRRGHLQMKKVIAHELYHIYQAESSGLDFAAPVDRVPTTGPQWLTEGTARFAEYRALLRAGILNRDVERKSGIPKWVARQVAYVDEPLSSMETRLGLDAAGTYNFALLAAEILSSFAGERALMRFYVFLQPQTLWQQAFQSAFGMRVEEFYSLFEEHRASGFVQA